MGARGAPRAIAAAARGGQEQDDTAPVAQRSAATGPSRDPHSAALLATIAERAKAFDPATLAAEFLGQLAGDDWPGAFEAWAQERQLGPELRQAVRVQIIRARCFGALRRARPKARAR